MAKSGNESYLGDSPWSVAEAAKLPFVIDHEALADMVFFAALPARPDVSLLKGIMRVPSGAMSLPARADDTESSDLGFLIGQLSRALRATISEHVSEAFRPAVLVTGGLDSAVVAALTAQVAQAPPLLIAIRGGLSSTLECANQQILARELRAELLVIDDLPRFTLGPLLRHNHGRDFPSGGVFTHIWDHAVRRASDKGCDLLLTGEGGNEAFALTAAEAYDHVLSGHPWRGWSVLARTRDDTSTSLSHSVQAQFRRRGLQVIGPPSVGGHVNEWRGDLHKEAKPAVARRRAQFRRMRHQGLSYAEIDAAIALERHELYDAGGLAEDTKVLAPLADPRVLTALWRVPAHLRSPGRVGTRDKHALRLIGRQHLCSTLTEAKKIGISNQMSVLLGDQDIRQDVATLSEGATLLGLDLSGSYAQFAKLPVGASLVWTRLLAFSAWSTTNMVSS